MSTILLPGIKEEVDQSLDRTWTIIAFNDDVTPFDLVILALVQSGLTPDQAIEKTVQIHNEGSSVIKSGLAKEDAVKKYNIIKDITKGGGRFPGIDMSLVEDL